MCGCAKEWGLSMGVRNFRYEHVLYVCMYVYPWTLAKPFRIDAIMTHASKCLAWCTRPKELTVSVISRQKYQSFQDSENCGSKSFMNFTTEIPRDQKRFYFHALPIMCLIFHLTFFVYIYIGLYLYSGVGFYILIIVEHNCVKRVLSICKKQKGCGESDQEFQCKFWERISANWIFLRCPCLHNRGVK